MYRNDEEVALISIVFMGNFGNIFAFDYLKSKIIFILFQGWKNQEVQRLAKRSSTRENFSNRCKNKQISRKGILIDLVSIFGLEKYTSIFC